MRNPTEKPAPRCEESITIEIDCTGRLRDRLKLLYLYGVIWWHILTTGKDKTVIYPGKLFERKEEK